MLCQLLAGCAYAQLEQGWNAVEYLALFVWYCTNVSVCSRCALSRWADLLLHLWWSLPCTGWTSMPRRRNISASWCLMPWTAGRRQVCSTLPCALVCSQVPLLMPCAYTKPGADTPNCCGNDALPDQLQFAHNLHSAPSQHAATSHANNSDEHWMQINKVDKELSTSWVQVVFTGASEADSWIVRMVGHSRQCV